MTSMINPTIAALLDEPQVAALGTVRPDGTPQVNPMWYERDGDTIRFTHTSQRAKYRNLLANPAMTLMVTYPGDAYRYVELRGVLKEVIEDPEGAFYVRLAERYGEAEPKPPADKADRVILVMSISKVIDG